LFCILGGGGRAPSPPSLGPFRAQGIGGEGACALAELGGGALRRVAGGKPPLRRLPLRGSPCCGTRGAALPAFGGEMPGRSLQPPPPLADV
jgi:hypothetical protein